MYALLLAAVLSTAGGIVAHGIFFLANVAYAFDDRLNLWLAVALFVPYVPAALLAGRVGRAVGPRRAMLGLNAVMILAGLVLATRPPVWVLWMAAPLYNGAAGMLWPLVEGYVAGGRHGTALHRTIGHFNLTWALTLAPALWIVGLAGENLLASFAPLIALHVLGAGFIARLPPAPAPPDHDGAPVGEEYRRLLRSSRVLLPVSYVLMDALSPLLPGVWARLGVTGAVAPLLSSTWMLARFGVFAGLTWWSAWRGRRAALVVGALVLIAGFAATLGATSVGIVLAGLIAFGIGQGTLYYQALYYGMAVGKGEVDSGGHHEAVIGLGYLGGPALALLGMSVGVAPIHAVGALATAGLAAGALPWVLGRGARGAPSRNNW